MSYIKFINEGNKQIFSQKSPRNYAMNITLFKRYSVKKKTIEI